MPGPQVRVLVAEDGADLVVAEVVEGAFAEHDPVPQARQAVGDGFGGVEDAHVGQLAYRRAAVAPVEQVDEHAVPGPAAAGSDADPQNRIHQPCTDQQGEGEDHHVGQPQGQAQRVDLLQRGGGGAAVLAGDEQQRRDGQAGTERGQHGREGHRLPQHQGGAGVAVRPGGTTEQGRYRSCQQQRKDAEDQRSGRVHGTECASQLARPVPGSATAGRACPSSSASRAARASRSAAASSGLTRPMKWTRAATRPADSSA